MILKDLKEYLKKNQLSREDAIAQILKDWARSIDVSLTAVVSIEEDDGRFVTIAVGAFSGPEELLVFHHVAHKELVDSTMREKDEDF